MNARCQLLNLLDYNIYKKIIEKLFIIYIHDL